MSEELISQIVEGGLSTVGTCLFIGLLMGIVLYFVSLYQ